MVEISQKVMNNYHIKKDSMRKAIGEEPKYSWGGNFINQRKYTPKKQNG